MLLHSTIVNRNCS